MIKLRTQDELKKLRHAGHIVGICHSALNNSIVSGVTPCQLDALVEEIIGDNGGYPAFKGYQGFPNATCISVNHHVVHGIPNQRPLEEGDILSIDIGVKYQGYIGDSSWTYGVGRLKPSDQFLLTHTEQALWKGLNALKTGVHLSNVSLAIASYANQHRLGIVKELTGHGVGTQLHEPPIIPNYGPPNQGILLQAGMVLAIEPILTLGSPKIKTLKDKWTVITEDGSHAAHFEHTVAVEQDGYTVLTQPYPNKA